MDENIVGYVLNALDDAERAEMEAYLARHPEARRRVDLVRQALAPLAADKQDVAPPHGLVYKTLAWVAENVTRGLPPAPQPLAGRVPAARPIWRRLDALVAACLLVTVVGLGISTVMHLRGQNAAKLECQNNLREYYQALQQYHQVHHTFPNVQREGEPRNVAGLVVPMLVDKKVLPQTVSVRCPGNGPPRFCTLTLDQLRAMPEAEFLQHAPDLLSCYSYSLGYVDKDVYFPAQLDADQHLNSLLPLMADCPPRDQGPGNSRNHGGGGQNVLFQDGHVKFTTARNIGPDGDDIFLNKANKVAAGRDRRDVVLGHSASKP